MILLKSPKINPQDNANHPTDIFKLSFYKFIIFFFLFFWVKVDDILITEEREE